MDFFRAMDVSATGLIVQRYRMNIAAENLANIESTRTASGSPYRRKQLVISSMGDSFPNIFMEAQQSTSQSLGGARVANVVEDPTPFKSIHRPGHPDADKDGFVLMPNVVSILEMADIISATRAYEVNIAAFSAAKSMVAKSLELGK